MRIVVQRVASARVTIDGRETAFIQRGLVVLLGIEEADSAADGEWLTRKLATIRIFDDAAGKMNHSLLDLAGATGSASNLPPPVLLVSQFTLFASTQKGARPSFNRAAKPDHARPLYEQFIAQLTATLGQPPATGEFGAMMQVELVNDGPVTLILDSKTRE